MKPSASEGRSTGARGVHRYNYADLPMTDMLFGTFRNAGASVDLECGFYNGASSRLPEMLIGRDVAVPKAGADEACTPAGSQAA